MCILVDSTSNGLDSYCADIGEHGMNVVKINDSANFYNWWPTMAEFIFLQSKAAPKVLNYSLETVHTHEDDQLSQRLTRCLDAFVDSDKRGQRTMCQTVRVVECW